MRHTTTRAPGKGCEAGPDRRNERGPEARHKSYSRCSGRANFRPSLPSRRCRTLRADVLQPRGGAAGAELEELAADAELVEELAAEAELPALFWEGSSVAP